MTPKPVTLLLVLIGSYAAHHSCAFAEVGVRLTAPKKQYLIGEPIPLQITVTNTGTEPVRMLPVLAEPEIEIYTSEDGKDYRKWTLPIEWAVNIGRREPEMLYPNNPKRYLRWVLLERGPEFNLVFERPGNYWIKAVFPLVEIEPYQRTEIESNSLQMAIVPPRGPDAQLWRKIRDMDLLPFLQMANAKEPALRAIALLKMAPDTAYAPALRSALDRYYYGYTRGAIKLDENEAELLRSVLEIASPGPQPFPEDKRLDQMITYSFPQQIPLEKVVKDISEQSDVRLELDPALRVRTMSSLQISQPLREFMRNLATYKAKWEPKGDGYLLRFFEEQPKPE